MVKPLFVTKWRKQIVKNSITYLTCHLHRKWRKEQTFGEHFLQNSFTKVNSGKSTDLIIFIFKFRKRLLRGYKFYNILRKFLLCLLPFMAMCFYVVFTFNCLFRFKLRGMRGLGIYICYVADIVTFFTLFAMIVVNITKW